MASSKLLLVLLGVAISNIAVNAQPVRLYSASLYDLTKGLTAAQLAQNDINATIAALKWQNSQPGKAGSVVFGVAGTALNQEVSNGALKPEWASYAKVIEFKDQASYKVYASKVAPSFSWPSYTGNKAYTLSKAKFVGVINAKDLLPKFATWPAGAVVHASAQNATAGISSAAINAVVTGRQNINKAVASLYLTTTVYPWTSTLAATDADPTTLLNLGVFANKNGAVANKAYKGGNGPVGPVGPLPLYTATEALVNVKRDIEFTPINLLP